MVTLPRTGTLLAILLLHSPIASAQGPPLVLGTRVRVTTLTAKQTGLYRGADQANLMLQVDSITRTIPRGTIEQIERSTGKKPNTTLGIVGLLLGMGVGGALGCLANKDDYGVYCGGQDDTKVIVGAALGGLAGAAAGALLFKKEGWQAVLLPQ